MNTQIDFRTLPISIPSLCIPRVFANIDEKRIRGIFDELSMGEIHRIDIVSKTTDKGEKFNRVFVHFRRWFANANADTARERLLNGKEIKIIYDDPWFWKVSAYREANPGSRPGTSHEKPAHKKPSLKFDSDEDEPSRQTNHSSRDTDEFGRNKDYRRPPQRQDTRPQQRPDQRDHRPNPRPQHRDRRPDTRDRRPPRDEVKKIVPRSPSNSPPRQRQDEEQVLNPNYESRQIPKRRIMISKKPLKIEEDAPIPAHADEKEEGEIEE
jgi:hypothetical protein